ncbi:uncharacterized protein LOC128682517 [Plodia interpunctella]|uniref:uncharacterized protein LOC128680604 n=1 Tax=Plodia interpunctella TaxID=58824 RepID=UPI002367AA67|nr:uncharacterized protein LOC128680604 [Plodia interpunctella]XP_053623232.1 uncharacterized protein LOC128682517 [Plodia interpunctella]
MAPSIICGSCLFKIESRQYLKCFFCSKYYDLTCANVSEKRFFNTMSSEHKKNWKCIKCINNKGLKSGNSPATPQTLTDEHDGSIHSPIVPTRNINRPIANTTQFKSNKNQQITPPMAPPIPTEQHTLETILSEIRLNREEMQATRTEIRELRSAFTAAIGNCNQRIDELFLRVEAIEAGARLQRESPADMPAPTSSEILNLEQTIATLKLDINDRDQQLLNNDIEIAGIPEYPNELGIHMAITLSSKLGISLEERDIVSVERAGPVKPARPLQQDSDSKRPRPLVVKLARRVLRDQLLNAARVRRGLSTAALDFSTTSPIYINERLTRTNRQLFYQARAEASRLQWKYVWTRDGNIFVRKEHGSSRYRIRTETDITKIFCS